MENYKSSFKKKQRRKCSGIKVYKKSVDVTPKAQSIKEKIEKLNHIKI